MVRVGRVLIGSCRNAFAVIDNESERTEIVNLRAEFAKRFIELFLKNNENESAKDLPFKMLMPTKIHQKQINNNSNNVYGNNSTYGGNLYGAADSQF